MDSLNSRKRAFQDEFYDTKPNKRPIIPEESGSENSDEGSEVDGIFANDVISLRLISTPSDMLDSNPLTFPPEFTNQIFGEEESIHGYEDLKIRINFLASLFYANIEINYSKKEENADNIHESFGKAFKGGYFKEKPEFEKLFNDEKNFKPYGKLIKEFENQGVLYEIYYCDFSFDGFAEYNKRIQILLLFFINGASFIEEDANWRVYLVYSKEGGFYKLVAYSTVYMFFRELKRCRYRISQFLVLPPFQRKGLGLSLISLIYQDALQDEACFEITVEDAAIGFQFLRDCKDFELLMNEKCFDWASEIKGRFTAKIYQESKETLGKETIKELKRRFKLRKNQILRVIEIMRFIQIKENDDEAEKLFREDVKKRLEQANKEEFYPFLKKKIPYVCYEGIPAIINPAIYKNSTEAEVNAKLEEYVNQIISDYEEIKPKILNLFSKRKP